MPTPLTHALIPLALGHTVTDKKLPLRFWFLAVFCSVWPDADVIGFRFGVSYGDFFGHRGFFHSLFFAFLLSSTVMLLAFRKPAIFSKKWWLIWLFFLCVSSSHGILDAFTNGGLGIALLSPFKTTRYFSPWRPFVVAPFRIRELFTPWGKEVLLSELYWIWLPLVVAIIIAKAYRKIKLMNHDKTKEAECQSVELAKNIFKRLFVVLLIILLIAGIFFQAPWKVLVLLAIFLAALTVLPKPARKLFWLSVAAIVIALIIWVFLPEDSEGWQPYTFDEELAALEAKHAIPDSENAAAIYNQLLEDYNDTAFYGNLSDSERSKLPIRQPWLSQEHPELIEWIKSHESTIAKLKEAAAIEKYHFTITHPEDEQRMRRSRMVRRWAFLLISAANNDLGQGRIDEALEKLTTVLQMGKHYRQQPIMMDMLVGIAIEAFAVGHFKSFIVDREATEHRLTVIEDSLLDIKHDWTSDWPKIIDSQKLMTKDWLCSAAYEVNPQDKVRVSRDPIATIRAQIEAVLRKETPPLTYGRKKLFKAAAILTWFYIPSTPQRAAKVIDNCYKRYYTMADPAFDWGKGPREFSIISTMMSVGFNYRYLAERTVCMSEQSFYRIHDIYFRVAADNHGSRLIVALRRYKNEHGRWPENLDDIKDLVPKEILVDPINGGSFVYKLTEENFTLYSKGKNNIDEGGIRDKESGADDWLIWPPKTRKTTNEKADTAQSNTQKNVVK